MPDHDESRTSAARERAISELGQKGFELLADGEDTSIFHRLINVSSGAPPGMKAYFNGGSDGLLEEPVIGFAAVELIVVSDEQIAHGVADSVRQAQSIEPLILLEGQIELALRMPSYLGLARGEEEAQSRWGEQVRARAHAEARLAAAAEKPGLK